MNDSPRQFARAWQERDHPVQWDEASWRDVRSARHATDRVLMLIWLGAVATISALRLAHLI